MQFDIHIRPRKISREKSELASDMFNIATTKICKVYAKTMEIMLFFPIFHEAEWSCGQAIALQCKDIGFDP